jgi:hypothetical protein
MAHMYHISLKMLHNISLLEIFSKSLLMRFADSLLTQGRRCLQVRPGRCRMDQAGRRSHYQDDSRPQAYRRQGVADPRRPMPEEVLEGTTGTGSTRALVICAADTPSGLCAMVASIAFRSASGIGRATSLPYLRKRYIAQL